MIVRVVHCGAVNVKVNRSTCAGARFCRMKAIASTAITTPSQTRGFVASPRQKSPPS